MNISRTAQKITAVISDKQKIVDTHKLELWLNDNCVDWSYILHDKDVDDNGELKTNHYHVVFKLKKTKIRLSTTINSLSKALNISEFAISCDKADNYGLCLQYLIHRNNPEKYQYGLNMVVSSLPLEEFTLVMSETIDIINFDLLKNVCRSSCGSKMYIMEKIGIGYYSKYRNVIKDIIEELDFAKNKFEEFK